MPENLFLQSAHDRGLIDDREIAFVADTACTNGNKGRAWFFLSGSMLTLYECVGLGNLGEFVEGIDLKKAKFLKGSGFVLGTSLKFQYEGLTYTFKGFAQGKRVVETIRSACGA